MEESKIGIEIAKGIKGAIQEFLVPDIRTIINELKHHTMLLGEHGQKLEKLTDSIHQLDLKQTEILTKLNLEERVRRLEQSQSLSVGPEGEREPKQKEIRKLFGGRPIKSVRGPKEQYSNL